MNALSKTIFQDNQEIARLAVQNRLLKAYEQPVYDRVMAGRSNLKLLDIGCNNGSKTVDRFTGENFSRVIGLEYHPNLAAQARQAYGNDRFTFYHCDVEESGFARRLAFLMKQTGVAAFDIIHISYVLLHLKNPGALLRILRGFLAPGGRLIVVESNDSVSGVCPDPNHLFRGFLDILYRDPFSGDRDCGAKLPALLAECGYRRIALESAAIRAGEGETQKKRDIFYAFFSYLPQDVLLLQRQEPRNDRYAAWAAYLEEHFEALRNLILDQNTRVSMGVSIVTCSGDEGGDRE